MARLASTSSPEVRAGPVPLIGVVMSSFVPAFSFGILTLGALPNVPETVTAELGSPVEPGERDEPEPQPTRARPASSGTISAAAMRRMKDPQRSSRVEVKRKAVPAYPL